MENVLQGEEYVQKLGDLKEQGLFQELAGQHGMGMKSENRGASVLGSKPGSAAALLSRVTLGKSFNLGDCVFSPIKWGGWVSLLRVAVRRELTATEASPWPVLHDGSSWSH